MKKMFSILMFTLLVAGFISGCSMSRGKIGHSIITDVQLNQANFKVIKSVTGEARANYILGIGPSDQNLISQAKRNMLAGADLVGAARAIINVTTDIKHSGFIVWRQKTAYVSAEVIEFTK